MNVKLQGPVAQSALLVILLVANWLVTNYYPTNLFFPRHFLLCNRNVIFAVFAVILIISNNIILIKIIAEISESGEKVKLLPCFTIVAILLYSQCSGITLG